MLPSATTNNMCQIYFQKLIVFASDGKQKNTNIKKDDDLQTRMVPDEPFYFPGGTI